MKPRELEPYQPAPGYPPRGAGGFLLLVLIVGLFTAATLFAVCSPLPERFLAPSRSHAGSKGD
jgi:hypothetical protein